MASFDLPITRVVGGANAIDSQGFLADPNKAIANGVISRLAEFRVHMTEGPFIPSSLPWPTVRANVKINGFRLDAYLQNEKHSGYTREFVLRFPSRYLKFPARGVADASPPLPRINKIEFYVDTSPVPAIPAILWTRYQYMGLLSQID